MGFTKVGGFEYNERGVMCCDGFPLDQIVGQIPASAGLDTPAYIYSYDALEANCKAVRVAFPDALVRYAVKANSNIHLLRIMQERYGFGFDVVSASELRQALRTDASGTDIVFAGAAKTNSEIGLAIENEVTLVVERPEELGIVKEWASSGEGAEILLRLRPNVDAHTHKHLTTGTAFSKFGMPESVVRTLLDELRGVIAKNGVCFDLL